uniref:Uncharacterized protein n=1 Tax=Zooxanthella nutricula TaxID=1333877 RepID=A0A7S2MBB5_9DINO
MYAQRYGESVDSQETREIHDGVPGVAVVGGGVAEQKVAYAIRMNQLFQSLDDAKSLYEQKYGESVDVPEAEERLEVQDGVPGVALDGCGAMGQRAIYANRMDALFDKLQEVKDLYARRYGEAADAPEPDERPESQGGVPGVAVVGRGAEVQRAAYNDRLDALVASLQEAKDLYARKYGDSADAPEPEERFETHQGVPGVATIGRGVDEQRAAYADKLAALFESLGEAKGLYAQRYGESVDAPEPDEQSEVQDGVPGVTVVGTGAVEQRAAYLIRVNSLFASLQEVKGLYERRCGEDVDASEAELRFEAEGGVPGVTLTGRGAEEQRASYATRVGALLARLRDVKALYAQRVGEQVDEDDSDASDAGDWPPALAERADELPRRSLAVPPLQSRLGLWARWAVRWEEGQELCGQGRPPAEHSGSDAESDGESE